MTSILALGRMRYGYALLPLERLFSHEATIVQEAAVPAALLLGSRTAEAHCRRLCEQRQTGTARPAFFLALCGRMNGNCKSNVNVAPNGV
jgi:hypothetical protein